MTLLVASRSLNEVAYEEPYTSPKNPQLYASTFVCDLLHIEDLLNRGWIRKSPHSPPVVCARDELRLCVDYRELNKRTTTDRHPLPRVEDTLDTLGGDKWFSLVYHRKAYCQWFMLVDSRPMTAFVTPWALYKWVNRIPFALSRASASFQNFMEECLETMSAYHI